MTEKQNKILTGSAVAIIGTALFAYFDRGNMWLYIYLSFIWSNVLYVKACVE